MIREISSAEITNVIADLCQKTNYKLTNDMTQKIKNGMENEKSEIGEKNICRFHKKSGYCPK